MLKVFKHFDDDNSGFLDSTKIRGMLNECFFNLDDNAIQNMISVADTDAVSYTHLTLPTIYSV